MTQTTSKIGVQILLEAFIHHGIEDIVFSPGSRNAPLVIGLVGSRKFRTVCIHDERCAAFYAMGMALVSRKPVPIICTSGSAVLNYAPAVAEAYYQRIPFLVVSADRPLEWIDQGDGQTIRQQGVFNNFIDYQVSFPKEATEPSMQSLYNDAIQKALNFAQHGPVHINMPFEEPLYKLVDYQTLNLPQHKIERPAFETMPLDYSALAHEWVSHEKRMIIVGQSIPNRALIEALKTLATDSNTIVLSENTSNVELDGIVPCIDRVLAAFQGDNEDYQPTGLLVLGGAVISKKIKAFLRASNLQLVWKVGEDFPEMTTYGRLDESFVLPAEIFLKNLACELEPSTHSNNQNFGNLWRNTFQRTEKQHQDFLNKTEYSDLKVVETILNTIPETSVLHLGNSSVARYAQLFLSNKKLEFHCNRGTSGIDGSVSTAIGAAAKQQDKMHTLIVGDVSFFYDSNALWNNYLTDNLRIVLIHNGGGGIFEIIPGPNDSSFRDEFFVAKHDFSAGKICEGFHIDYKHVAEIDSLKNALEELYKPSKNGRPKLLEIDTKHVNNSAVLNSYFKAME